MHTGHFGESVSGLWQMLQMELQNNREIKLSMQQNFSMLVSGSGSGSGSGVGGLSDSVERLCCATVCSWLTALVEAICNECIADFFLLAVGSVQKKDSLVGAENRLKERYTHRTVTSCPKADPKHTAESRSNGAACELERNALYEENNSATSESNKPANLWFSQVEGAKLGNENAKEDACEMVVCKMVQVQETCWRLCSHLHNQIGPVPKDDECIMDFMSHLWRLLDMDTVPCSPLPLCVSLE